MPSRVLQNKAGNTTLEKTKVRIGKVTTTALLDPLEWEDFKRICKAEGVTISKTLSGMIRMFNACYEHGFRLIKMGKVFVMPLICVRVAVPHHKRYRRKDIKGNPTLTQCLLFQGLVSTHNAIKRYRLEL